MKTRPKKAKKYSYTKDCKEQPREICDQCEKKSIQPLCDMEERLTCKYIPKEQCQDEDKQYYYKVEEVVVEEVCDMKFDTSYLQQQGHSDTICSACLFKVNNISAIR